MMAAIAAIGLPALAACSSAPASPGPGAAQAELRACQALAKWSETGTGLLSTSPERLAIEQDAAGTPLEAPVKAWISDTAANDASGVPSQKTTDDANAIDAICKTFGVEP
jgi:hypothetical protein